MYINMVKERIYIISVRGYMFKYLHGRLIFIWMGAEYISTQHRSRIRMYVCGPTLVAYAE